MDSFKLIDICAGGNHYTVEITTNGIVEKKVISAEDFAILSSTKIVGTEDKLKMTRTELLTAFSRDTTVTEPRIR